MKTWRERKRSSTLLLLSTIGLLMATPAAFDAQFDLCGCANVPNLQPFDSANSATYPPGTVADTFNITLPLPPDGILRFSSFRLVTRTMRFAGNAANTPVVILVAGDVTIANSGCCPDVIVSGNAGGGGSSAVAGQGGLGGPGGFRGGDGASQAINLAAIGGTGFGPGGGAGATAQPFVHGGGGTFLGLPELTPLIGGSGGGGGSSTSASATSCSAGGGGGGGGGLLIVANGTMTITNYQLFANGGAGAGSGNSTCASSGGGGSGGAIRLVANRFASGGTGIINAQGGSGGTSGTPGRIRLESVDSSSQTTFTTNPAALRIVGPTPIASPIAPTVAFTTINGSAVPAVPQGGYGAIDVIVSAPGATTFTLSTSGVPSGTGVLVTIKPRIGAEPMSQTVPVTNCTAAGVCDAVATFTLAAGAYVAEARATFQVQ